LKGISLCSINVLLNQEEKDLDRKGQLGNVAFGGAWSEQIPRRERLEQSVRLVTSAPYRTEEEDLRDDAELLDAVEDICATHPKGPELKHSWMTVLGIENPGLRRRELDRVAKALAAWTPG
jgi:hypothetical protein